MLICPFPYPQALQLLITRQASIQMMVTVTGNTTN